MTIEQECVVSVGYVALHTAARFLCSTRSNLS
jgi:hypothetical protein